MTDAPRVLRRGRFLFASLAIAWSGFIILLVVRSIPPGTPLSNDIADFFIDPARLVQQWSYLWDPTVFLGQELGTSQGLLPAALFYDALAHIHITGRIALCIYLCLIVLTSFASFLTLAYTLRLELRLSRSSMIIAAAFYSLNFYLLGFLPKIPSGVWMYALVPFAIACAYRGIKRNQPLKYAAIIALLSLVQTGANGAILLISALCWFAAVLIFVFSGGKAGSRIGPAAILTVLTPLLALAVNSYWVVPFVNQIPRIWSGGVLSEDPVWHSAVGNVFDVLRLSNGTDLRGSDESGLFFVFGSAYQGITIASAMSLALPIIALGAFAFHRVRRLKMARLLLIAFCLSVIMGSGSYPGAWFGVAWLFAYQHIPYFQILRSIAKWDVASALCIAIFLAMAVTQISAAIGRYPRIHRIPVGWAVTGTLLILQALFLAPILTMGLIPARQLVNVPAYWHSAAEVLHLPIDLRSLVLPKAYVPKFFWGDVGSDFPEPFLKRPTTFLITNGTVAPSADTSLVLRAAYDGIDSDSSWTVPLLQRLSIGQIIQERDAYYYTEEQGQRDPLTVGQEAISGAIARRLKPAGSVGLVDAYSVPVPMPMTRTSDIWMSSVADRSLYKVFALVHPDIAIGELTPEAMNGHRQVVLLGRGGLLDASVAATAALEEFQGNAGSRHLQLGSASNVDVFVRDRLEFPGDASVALRVDGRPFSATRSPYWSLAAALRPAPGDHEISVSASSPIDVKIVKDSDLKESQRALMSAAGLGLFITDVSGDEHFWLRSGVYDVRVAPNPAPIAWSIPLSFGSVRSDLPQGCHKIAFLTGALQEQTLQPPPMQWYSEPGAWHLAADGRVNISAFGPQGVLNLLNLSSRTSTASIHSALGAVDQKRKVTFSAPGTVAKTVNLALSPLTDFALTLDARPGLTQIPAAGSPADTGLLWEAVGAPTAVCLATSEPGRLPMVGSPRLQAPPDQPLKSIIPIGVPHVQLGTLPAVNVPIANSDGPFSVFLWVAYTSRGVAHWVPASLESTSAAGLRFDIRAGPEDGPNPTIQSLLLVADVSKNHTLELGRPTLELRRVTFAPYVAAGSPRLLPDWSLVLPESRAAGAVVNLSLAVRPASFEQTDLQLRLPAHDVIGEVYQLAAPAVSVVRPQVQQLQFKLPVTLSATQQELWRSRVRLFKESQEIAPSSSVKNTAYSFVVDANSVTVEQPVAGQKNSHWRIAIIPDSWVQHNLSSATEQIFIPLETGASDLDGHSKPLPNLAQLVPVHSASAPPAAAPTVEQLTYQEPSDQSTGALAGNPPRLEIDGAPVRLTWSATRQYWSGIATLARQDHVLKNSEQSNLSLLLSTSNHGGSKMPSCPKVRVDRETPDEIDVSLQQPVCGQAIINNQMYNLGWVAADQKGALMTRIKVDGYANGFLLGDDTRRVSLRFEPGSILLASRAISVASTVMLLALLLMLSVVQRNRQPK